MIKLSEPFFFGKELAYLKKVLKDKWISPNGSIAKKFKSENPNNLFTYCKSRKNPYFNMIKKINNIFKLIKQNKKKILRRQDAPKVYEMNASIYIWKKKFLFLSNNFFANDTIGYEISFKRSIDIDNLSDYKIVKKLINNT